MSNVNKALAVLAALAFFLPFVSFSCSTAGLAGMTGTSIAPKFSFDVSGAKLVQCYLNPCSPKDLFASKLGPFAQYMPDSEIPASAKIGGRDGKDVGLNFLLFAAIAVVVAAIVLFYKARGGELLSGLVSVGAIVLLVMFRSKFGDAIGPELNSPELKAAGSLIQIQVQYGIGFWACAVLSGLSAILAFKGNLGGKALAVATPGSTGGYAPPPQPGSTTQHSSEQLAVCSACGSVNTAGSKFCLSCGAVMAAAPPPRIETKAVSQPQGPVCPSCGSSNAGTGKFCLACGASMSAPAVQAPAALATQVAAAAPAEPKVVAESQGPVCPSCGSSNAGTGKFCLACGASMAAPAVQAAAALAAQAAAASPAEPKVVAEPQGPVCPACGSSNAGTGKFCLACGAPMSASAVQAAAVPPAEPIAAEPQGPVCPSCGSSKAGTGRFCLACGASMSAPAVQAPAAPAAQTAAPPAEPKVVTEPQSPVCPACGSSNPGTGKFCLACGGSLMAGVQLFQPSETSAPAAPVAPVAVAAAAAQASVTAPVGQPLRAVAPTAAPEPPVQPPVVAQAAPPVDEPKPPVSQSAPPQPVEQQRALDWTTPEPKSAACAACGATLKADQKFCLACGTPVGQVSASAQTEEAPPFTPAPQLELKQPKPEHRVCASCGATFTPDQQSCLVCGKPVKKASGAKVWIVIALGLAALGAGGYFGWKYFTRPDVTVSASVQRIHVAAGGKTSLEASVSGSSDTDVDWSVQEGQKGGQITALGTVMSSGQMHSGALYTAPQASGTYHVIAASHANPSRSAKIEVIVGGDTSTETPATTTAPAPPPTPTATTTSTAPASTPSPSPAFSNAAQIVGTWTGPTADMRTVIGADSTISMTSAQNPQKNLSGTYHFNDNTHLDVDFGNGDVRKWEILGVDNSYLRVSSQSKDGSSAIIFAKAQ